MNEYEKYRLQWMLDHDYSLPDLLERLSDIAMNENLDEIQNPRVMLNEAFELQDELTSARNRQKEINKILDTSGNENSKVVVEDDLEEERNESCMEL